MTNNQNAARDRVSTAIIEAHIRARHALAKCTPYLRYGQAWMDALPCDMSNLLTGSECDPYFDNSRIRDAELYLFKYFS